jgi:DNA-binding transcriptional ArsR family regulator
MAKLLWDNGTAYDFFVSLFVLHYAEDFGLRPSWTAGVRQRLAPQPREFLVHLSTFAAVPLSWVLDLPAPKDAATALQAIADMPAAERLPALTLTPETHPEARAALFSISRRGTWTEDEQKLLQAVYYRRGMSLSPAALAYMLKSWAEAERTGTAMLEALQEYQAVFFAEEEARIRPALEAGLQRGKDLAAGLPVDALVEELSRGIHLTHLEATNELTLVPSFWTTPLIFLVKLTARKSLLLYGVRPEVESVAPGAETADTLVTSLKSLADPTRLRILRYLSDGPQSPSELARRLRLRPPTVIHHLKLLRLAGLVHVIVSDKDEKRYASRLESLKGIYTTLEDFLSKPE